MNDTIFSIRTATQLSESTEQFPVDFDQAWPWLGYSRKDSAKQALMDAGFVEGIDFQIDLELGTLAVPRPEEKIRLTVECFKTWAMMAGTEQGKQVRLYFLECEKIAKAKIAEDAERRQRLRSVPKPKTLRQTVSDAKAIASIFTTVPADRKNIVVANYVAQKHPEAEDLTKGLIAAQPEMAPKEQSFTATEIGERMEPKLTARAANERLEALGYQESYRTARDQKKWKATAKGEPHAVLELSSKADGKPVEQLRWKESILGELKIAIAK